MIVLYMWPQENLFLLNNWIFVHYASEISPTQNKTNTAWYHFYIEIKTAKFIEQGIGWSLLETWERTWVSLWICGSSRLSRLPWHRKVPELGLGKVCPFFSSLPFQHSFHVLGCWWWFWWVRRRNCRAAFLDPGNSPQLWVQLLRAYYGFLKHWSL